MQPENDLIFISIASYRDEQLVSTVEDLLLKAAEPALLRFGICWQHGPEIVELPFTGDPRFRILDCDFRQSRGACWARAEIMKLWQGEQYFLQVDSHCRFLHRWDTKLIRMMLQTGSPKPILTTYANPFKPEEFDSDHREILSGPPQLMAIETFTDDGIPMLKPLTISGATTRTSPMHARFLSAGFLFAQGSFVQEVPYDPDLYFFGEEISMTLRAFTSGYDLFHPTQTVVWHDYVRAYATRHWEDHVDAQAALPSASEQRSKAWGELDLHSRARVRSLFELTAPDTPAPAVSFGLGSVRTLADYEAFTGISFRLRKIQDDTRRAVEPPNPPAPPDWPDRIYTWLVRVIVARSELAPEAFTDAQFWMVAIQDKDGQEIRRRDFTRGELDSLIGLEPEIALICEMQSGIIPATWTVWPCTRAKGWCNRVDGTLADSDFSIIEDDPSPEVNQTST